MLDGPKRCVYFHLQNGNCPIEEWLDGLKDFRGQAKIFARIRRLEQGNPGDVRSVGLGVFEMRIHFGSGYRIYFASARENVVVLLCGGDKSTQQSDIDKAHFFWFEYWRRM